MEHNYIVRKGDTLSKIAAANNTTVEKLCQQNGIENANKISIGQKLVLGEVSENTPQKADTSQTNTADLEAQVKAQQQEIERLKNQGLGDLVERDLNEAWTDIKQEAIETYEGAKETAKDAAKYVDKKYEQGKEYVKEKAKDVAEFAEETYEGAKETAKDAAEYVGEKYEQGKEYVKEKAQDVAEFAEETYEDAKEVAKDAAEYVDTKYEQGKEYVKEKAKDVAEFAEETYEDAKETAKDVASTAADKVSKHYKKVSETHEKIGEALKFDIKEPEKAPQKDLAQMTPEEQIKYQQNEIENLKNRGIDDLVEDAVDEMVDNAKHTYNNAIDKTVNVLKKPAEWLSEKFSKLANWFKH